LEGRIIKRILIIIILSCSAALSAHAQFFKDGLHLAYPTGGDVRDEQAGFGLQVVYEWTEYLSFETSFTRQTDRITDWNVVSAPFQNDFDLEIINAVVSGRIGYRLDRVNLYAGAGLGYYYMRADGKDTNRSIRENASALPPGLVGLQIGADVKNTFAYHIALGVEWIIVPRFEVFAEYRIVYLDTDVTFSRTEITRAPPTERTDLFKATTTRKEAFDYEHGLVRIGASLRF